MFEIVASSGESLPLKQYARPSRIVRAFNLYVSGKKVEAVTTRGERYTYLNVNGVDYFTDGLLQEGGKYKVRAVAEAAA
jgi:hypothetical protein